MRRIEKGIFIDRYVGVKWHTVDDDDDDVDDVKARL